MKALLVFGIIGSVIMMIAGINMTLIRSVAGNTVAEAFYNNMGVVFIGLGIFCITLIVMISRRVMLGYGSTPSSSAEQPEEEQPFEPIIT